MPTAKYFDKSPPFPSDVPVLDIPGISLMKLQRDDDHEMERLYDASREFGFFKLDLSECESGKALCGHAEQMLDISAETLSLDREVLDAYAYNPPRDLFGYKTAGKLKTDDGKLDAMEMYNLGQDDMLSLTGLRRNPPPLESNRPRCAAFFHGAGSAVGIVLTTLDKKLGLKPGTLSDLCPLDKPSDTSLRMLLSYPTSDEPQDRRITLGGHTDIGVITVLFNIVGGLQVLPAHAENTYENWRYIRPEPNCAIVNLGDTIVEWSGGLLRSSLHRVVNPPGEQANVTRQSLAYLVRPAKDMTMKRLESDRIPKAEEENSMGVSEWAAFRAGQIMRGELRPRTNGGLPVY